MRRPTRSTARERRQRRARPRLGHTPGRLEGADLHGGIAEDFGAVVGVIEGAGQAGVHGVDVIATVQVVIDEQLPIAVDDVLLALDEFHALDTEICATLR